MASREVETAAAESKPALGQASLHSSILGQIALRIRDHLESVNFYVNVLGMELFCRAEVPRYGFTLYMLGYYNNHGGAKNADLDAVDVREWVYQLPSTTIVLQLPAISAGPPLVRKGNVVRGGMSSGEFVEELLKNSKLSLERPAALPLVLPRPIMPGGRNRKMAAFVGMGIVAPRAIFDALAARARSWNKRERDDRARSRGPGGAARSRSRGPGGINVSETTQELFLEDPDGNPIVLWRGAFGCEDAGGAGQGAVQWQRTES